MYSSGGKQTYSKLQQLLLSKNAMIQHPLMLIKHFAFFYSPKTGQQLCFIQIRLCLNSKFRKTGKFGPIYGFLFNVQKAAAISVSGILLCPH